MGLRTEDEGFYFSKAKWVTNMWWWLEKLEDTDDAVIYAYGEASQILTGKIRIDKKSNEVTKIKIDDDDNEPLSAAFYRLVRHIIADAGYPEVRSIATG